MVSNTQNEINQTHDDKNNGEYSSINHQIHKKELVSP